MGVGAAALTLDGVHHRAAVGSARRSGLRELEQAAWLLGQRHRTGTAGGLDDNMAAAEYVDARLGNLMCHIYAPLVFVAPCACCQ
jgi:hypothetical protein